MTSVTIKVLSYHMSERKLGYLQMYVFITSINSFHKVNGPLYFDTFFYSTKLCGNCAFPKNFHTRKLGEIKVFFAV